MYKKAPGYYTAEKCVARYVKSPMYKLYTQAADTLTPNNPNRYAIAAYMYTRRANSADPNVRAWYYPCNIASIQPRPKTIARYSALLAHK